MRKKGYLLIAAVICAVCIVLLAELLHKDEGTLSFGMFSDSNWEIPDDKSAQVMERALSKFEEKNPAIKISCESGIQKADYSEWLAEKILQGTAPDVFVITKEDFVTLSAKGALLNLDEVIGADALFEPEKYYSSMLDSGQYEQGQYALPWAGNLRLMGVNTDLLEHEGVILPSNTWTWSDFHAICRRVTKDIDKNGKLDQFGFCDYTWKDAAYANGAVLFDRMGTESYMGDWKVINAVNFLYRLEGLNNDAILQSRNFEDGNVAFCPMSYSDFRVYKTYPWKVERYTDFNWTCISMPAGPQGDNISELETLLIGINAATKKKEEAWELLKFLSYDMETQREVAEDTMYLPVLKAVEEEACTQAGEDQNNFALLADEILNKAVAVPQFDKYDMALSMCNEGVIKSMDSERNISVSMIMLQREINSYLNNG